MTETGFVLFDTAIGCCGVVWGEHGIVGVQFPEGDERQTRNRLQRRFSAARETTPPDPVLRAIDDIVGLLGGEARDLRHVEIDIHGVPEFNRRVYAIARTVPFGATLSYGEIAERLGDRMFAREVGQALGQNPMPIIIPCHRVLAAGGKIGGFSAPGGADTKLRLLAIEGAQPGGPTLFDNLPQVAPRRRRA